MSSLLEVDIITDGGPWAKHNMPCPVCGQEPAVLQLWNGIFQPCWKCQKKGIITLQLPRWLMKLIRIKGIHEKVSPITNQ